MLLRRVIDQAVTLRDVFVNYLGVELIDMVCAMLTKYDLNNKVQLALAWMNVSENGETSIFWRSNYDGERK